MPSARRGAQALRVRGRTAETHAAAVLRDGDMLLAVGGQPVASFAAVERLLLPAAPRGAAGPPPAKRARTGAAPAPAQLEVRAGPAPCSWSPTCVSRPGSALALVAGSGCRRPQACW